jgi:hypothetical protein
VGDGRRKEPTDKHTAVIAETHVNDYDDDSTRTRMWRGVWPWPMMARGPKWVDTFTW